MPQKIKGFGVIFLSSFNFHLATFLIKTSSDRFAYYISLVVCSWLYVGGGDNFKTLDTPIFFVIFLVLIPNMYIVLVKKAFPYQVQSILGKSAIYHKIVLILPTNTEFSM